MARLEDRGKKGLPPPPAPPRRSANPWTYSSTARKRVDEPPPVSVQDLLDGIVVTEEPQSPVETPKEIRRQRAGRPPAKQGSGVWPLFILLIAIGIFVKVVSQGFEIRDWREVIAPLIAIAFIAHGWWRLRRRRQQKAGQDEDEKD